jgi:hypothetical protein
MPDYSTGKIYIIFSTSKKLLYIGSTIQTLSQRLAKHNNNLKNYKSGKYGWTSSFDVLECEDYKIELLELFPCCNKSQLEKREGECIKTYEKDGYTLVNNNIVGRTKKEYYTDNKQDILKQRVEYYEKNKQDILKQKVEYYEKHKQDILKQQAEYRAKNKQASKPDEPEM